MKANKGYTLIELIIVIAIMAILSGVAVVTLGIIKEAKCTSGADSFQNQLSSLWIKTKAISQGKEQSSPLSSDNASIYPLAMLITRVPAKEVGAGESSEIKLRADSYKIALGYYNGSTFAEDVVVGNMTEFLDIKYTPTTAAQKNAALYGEEDGCITSVLIQFDKSNGSVLYGAGTYEFMYNDRLIAEIYLDAVTGNHYTK